MLDTAFISVEDAEMEGFGNEGDWRLGGTGMEADEGGGRGSWASLGLFGRCGGGLR